jgi:hypothetical protein
MDLGLPFPLVYTLLSSGVSNNPLRPAPQRLLATFAHYPALHAVNLFAKSQRTADGLVAAAATVSASPAFES